MKKPRTLTCFTALAVLAAMAMPIQVAAQENQDDNHHSHARYTVKSLETLGGTQGGANGINDIGWVTGWANFPGDQKEHGVLWRRQTMTDLGTLGGPNSAVSWPVTDDKGVIAGNSQTSQIDPFDENFCTFSFDTTYICQGFRWQDGQMTPLPTLGGNNSWATVVNHRAQIAGFAETSTQDPSCTPPQVLDIEAVVWGPSAGKIQAFPPLPGDAVSAALDVNDRGQVVGGSGVCGTPSPAISVHAVLWEHDSVTDLGSFGGVINNMAVFINNRGTVVGISDLPGDTGFHAFLWTRDHSMRDLGTLPGDVLSFPASINDKDQVAGQSCDQNGNCRAFLWQDGEMTDLNALILPGSTLYLTGASDINNTGEIAGYAYDPSTGDTPAFLAIPCDEKHADIEGCKGQADGTSAALGVTGERQKVILPENVRKQLSKRLGFSRFPAGPMNLQRPEW